MISIVIKYYYDQHEMPTLLLSHRHFRFAGARAVNKAKGNRNERVGCAGDKWLCSFFIFFWDRSQCVAQWLDQTVLFGWVLWNNVTIFPYFFEMQPIHFYCATPPKYYARLNAAHSIFAHRQSCRCFRRMEESKSIQFIVALVELTTSTQVFNTIWSLFLALLQFTRL